MDLWPSKKQWKSWTLPSKLTFISVLLGLVAIPITSFYYVLGAKDSQRIQSQLDDLFIEKHGEELKNNNPVVSCSFKLRDTSKYKTGEIIEGVEWEPAYEKYELLIENKSKFSLYDFDLISALPGFVLTKDIVNSKTNDINSINFKDYAYESEMMEMKEDGSFVHASNLVGNRLDLHLNIFEKGHKICVWFIIKRLNQNGKLITRYFTDAEKDNGFHSASDIVVEPSGSPFYLSNVRSANFEIRTLSMSLDKTTLTESNPSKTVYIPKH